MSRTFAGRKPDDMKAHSIRSRWVHPVRHAALMLSALLALSASAVAQQPNDYFKANTDRAVGNALRQVERYHLNEKQTDLDFILRYFPNHPKALLLIGAKARLQNDPVLAIRYFEKAVGLYPQHAITHAQYGEFLVSVNKIEAGIERLKRAISMDPTLAAAHAWLAEAYFKQGKRELGMDSYQKARELGYKGQVSGLPENVPERN
jgi:Tfp pilus assembly protein PilF